jgi:hypothetical protein
MAAGRAPDAWVSASELADFAFCPRSHWYARHPSAAPPTAFSERRESEGERFHARTLAAVDARSSRTGYYVGLLLLGAALAVTAYLLLVGVP